MFYAPSWNVAQSSCRGFIKTSQLSADPGGHSRPVGGHQPVDVCRAGGGAAERDALRRRRPVRLPGRTPGADQPRRMRVGWGVDTYRVSTPICFPGRCSTPPRPPAPDAVARRRSRGVHGVRPSGRSKRLRRAGAGRSAAQSESPRGLSSPSEHGCYGKARSDWRYPAGRQASQALAPGEGPAKDRT